MKRNLGLIVEQIKGGLFTYRDFVVILKAIRYYCRSEWYDEDSDVDLLVKAIDKLIGE